MITLTYWRCIPCAVPSNTGPFRAFCGRKREDATDEARWARFFTLDAVIFPDADTERAVRLGASWPGSIETDIAALPADKAFEPDEDCQHQHVERDDDGLSGRWFTCTDCNETVVLETDEDGLGYWETVS